MILAVGSANNNNVISIELEHFLSLFPKIGLFMRIYNEILK